MPHLRDQVRRGQIDEGADVHDSAKIWDLAHIRSSAVVGARTIIGRSVYVGVGVVIGSDCKIQNGAQIFEPAVLDDGVFIGPGAILTNDRHPRAITHSGEIKSSTDWNSVGVYVEYGASIGAGAICIAPVRVGRWALVAAGAVLSCNASPYGLYLGAPARRVGWVGPAGVRLRPDGEHRLVCPVTSEVFQLDDKGEVRFAR